MIFTDRKQNLVTEMQKLVPDELLQHARPCTAVFGVMQRIGHVQQLCLKAAYCQCCGRVGQE